jgi:hypothetical protein
MLINGVRGFSFSLAIILIIDFLARVNSLYRVRDGKISQIVKSDPQWPQSFYPLPSSVKIEKGDYVVGQCVYDNNDDRVITAG